MGCECKHRKEEIEQGYEVIDRLRELFIARMTVDSETQDARRRDFNQAIFFFKEEGDDDAIPVFSETTMNMVLQCFDDATKDWRREFCDVEDCHRNLREKKHGK